MSSTLFVSLISLSSGRRSEPRRFETIQTGPTPAVRNRRIRPSGYMFHLVLPPELMLKFPDYIDTNLHSKTHTLVGSIGSLKRQVLQVGFLGMCMSSGIATEPCTMPSRCQYFQVRVNYICRKFRCVHLSNRVLINCLHYSCSLRLLQSGTPPVNCPIASASRPLGGTHFCKLTSQRCCSCYATPAARGVTSPPTVSDRI